MPRRKAHELYKAFNRWGFDSRGYSASTRYQYYLTALRTESWMQAERGCSLTWATTRDLQAFLFSLPPSAHTRNGARQALVAAFDSFIDRGLVKINMAKPLSKLPEPRSLPKALSPDQARAVLKAAEMLEPQARAAVYILAFAGLRRAEALRLQWSEVEHGWLRFMGKGAKERAIPMHLLLTEQLKAWRSQCPSPRWVIPSPIDPDKPASGTWLASRLKQLAELSGVEGLHPHQMRHTAATLLLESGADIRTVQEFLGHTSVATTTVYTRIRPARLADAVAKLDYASPVIDLTDDSAGKTSDA